MNSIRSKSVIISLKKDLSLQLNLSMNFADIIKPILWKSVLCIKWLIFLWMSFSQTRILLAQQCLVLYLVESGEKFTHNWAQTWINIPTNEQINKWLETLVCALSTCELNVHTHICLRRMISGWAWVFKLGTVKHV